MVSLNEVPQTAITLVVVAAVFVAAFLVVTGMGDSQYNQPGCNSTDQSSVACGGYKAANNFSSGMTQIVNYAPTWGVVIGVAVLLGVVLAGFGFARNKGFV